MAAGQAVATTIPIDGINFSRGRVASHIVYAIDETDRMLVVRILHVRQDAERHLAQDREA